jgi:hypothetical protein
MPKANAATRNPATPEPTPIARNVNSVLRARADGATLPAMTKSIRWGLAVVATILAEIVLIALSIICVAIYSYTIHTGESQEFYNAFARASGPWVSLVAGGPAFFLIARWIRRRAGSAAFGTAMAVAGLYLAIEVVILLLWPGDATGALPFAAGGMVLKVAGAWLGAGGMPRRAASQVA